MPTRHEDRECNLIPYESLMGARSLLSHQREAQRTLADGWSLGGYPPVDLGRPISWGLRSPAERSWNFYLHCWDMLEPFLQVYSSSGVDRYLQVAIDVAMQWVSIHLDATDTEISPFAWYDMAVGLRAYRLAYVLDAGSAAGMLDASAKERLWAALHAHRRYLDQDDNIAFHSNHGFYQVAGQLAMARRFGGQSAEMAQSRQQALERLGRMMDRQFAADGVHREHSPDYHRMVYQTLKALLDSGLVDDIELHRRALEIERALAWFVRPDGYIANFGDSDHRSMTCRPDQARTKWATEEMRYVVTGGQIGAPPASRLRAFPEAGYWVVRADAARDQGETPGGSYLAQTAAFHSRTHKHADDLSFIWFDRGRELLVDAGRYGYIGKTDPASALARQGYWYSDPHRIYCETTRAHNTLEFDNTDFPRRGAKPYGSALGRCLETPDGTCVLESETKHFRSLRHARVLLYRPGRWLVVFDWFHDNVFQRHDARQWFHLAPDLEISPEGSGFSIPVDGASQPLRVVSLFPDPVPTQPVSGQGEPVMQGWWSPREREMHPNHAFSYRLDGRRTGCFATLFCFTRHLEVDWDWARAPASGRKVRFCWKDDAGARRIWLARPADGAIDLVERPA